MLSRRDTTVDVMRGIAIILVVLGHAGINDYSWNAIYFFHMPLFFFISGCFFKPLKENSIISYMKTLKWKSLYRPFVIYSLLFLAFTPLLYYWGISGTHLVTWKEWIKSVELILRFRTASVDLLNIFWFLPVLFAAHALFLFISIKIQRKWQLAIIAVFLFLLGRWCYNHGYNEPYDFSRIMYLSAFYIGGFCSYSYLNKYATNIWLFLGALFSFFYFTFTPHEVFASILCYMYVALCGILITFFVSIQIVKTKCMNDWLSYIGKHTMSIYVFHTIAIKCSEWVIAKNGIIEFSKGWPGRAPIDGLWWFYTVIGIVVPIVFVWMKSRILNSTKHRNEST